MHWKSKQKITPIQLLVLCTLQYLGRFWTIDDLEESIRVNKETIHTFIHLFLEFGSTVLYEKFVNFPTTSSEIKYCEFEYLLSDFLGCIILTDEIHVII